MIDLPKPYDVREFVERRHVVGWSRNPICGDFDDPIRAPAEGKKRKKPKNTGLCPRCLAVLRGRGLLDVKRGRKAEVEATGEKAG